MESLLKTVGSITDNKKALIKDSLQTHLNMSVVEIESAFELNSENVLGNCDEATSLCAVLEAIFLHGLKDSLLNRVTQALHGPDFDSVPQPSFWGPLLVLSHGQVIKQIQSLSQITTEVGYCRAWIRQALNEGMLANYLCCIKRDNSTMKPYYNHWAYVRDPDLVDVAQKLMESLDNVSFTLSCNSSLLNSWSNIPLLLAGIWSPPMKSCPIVSAVDIAKTITNDIEQTDEIVEEVETTSSVASSFGIGSFNSSQSAFNNIANITEDRALKIILANDRSDTILCELSSNFDNGRTQRTYCVAQQSNNSPTTNTVKKEQEQNEIEDTSSDNAEGKDANIDTKDPQSENALKDNEVECGECNDATAAVGNSLVGKLGWSTSFDGSQSPVTSSVISESGANVSRTLDDNISFEELIESYQNMQNTPSRMQFMKQYSRTAIIKELCKAAPSKQKEVINFAAHLCNISIEKGLDKQNYTCFDCDHPIGMTFSKAHVCSYSGYYFCSDCMAEGQCIIPSRMIHNWDLKQYPVSRKVAEFLEKDSTLIDLKTVNPKIYMTVDIMAQLQSLRVQLNLLRAYLFTCREPIIESLQQKVAQRVYLYEHVHQYSTSDLLDVPNGILAQQIQKVVEFAKDHVISCWLCKQKGFICEVCNNPKVIFPFDLESTFRCGECNAVYHANCLNTSKPCPKCVRKRNRMDMPLLNIGCTDTDLHNNLISSSTEGIETK